MRVDGTTPSCSIITIPPDWTDCAELAGLAEGTPVIVVTGWAASDGRFRRRAFDAGCAAYVLKPCTPETLVEAVERVRGGERRIELDDSAKPLV